MESFTKTVDLVKRAQEGDGEALNRIFSRYYERIRIPVRLMLGSKLRQRLDSNDILQEIFKKLFEDGLGGFEMRDEGSFLSYLRKRAFHEICRQSDHWSSLVRHQDREVPLEPRKQDGKTSEQGRALTPDSAPILEKLVRSEDSKVLEECLGLLKEQHREVLVLRDFLGLSWKQIEEELGLNTENAARERRRTALVKLSGLLHERGVHEDTE